MDFLDLQDLSQLVGIIVLFEGSVEQVVCYRMAAVLGLKACVIG